jgi:Tfp pilus assembly protein FimT
MNLKLFGTPINNHFFKRTGECLHTQVLEQGVPCLAVNISKPNDSVIYFGKTNGVVSLWDIETQQEISSHQVTTGVIEGLQVCNNIITASNYTRIIVKDVQGTIRTCKS